MGLLLLAALLAAPPDAHVETLTGQTVAGQVTALGNDSLTLATTDGPRTFPVKELASASFAVPASAVAAPAAWITLTDHSQLLATAYTVTGVEAKIALLGGGTIDVPTAAIDAVRFRDHTGALSDQWSEIGQADRSADLLVIRKNEALDFLAGIVRDVTGDSIQFELDGEVRKVKRTKIDGLLYHRSARAAVAATHATLRDVGGSQWQLESISLDGELLKLRTAAGLELVRHLSDVARLDFSQVNVQHLSDLKPESVVWTPYLGRAEESAATRLLFQPRTDCAADGGPLRLEGRDYAKGLSLHSRTEIVYRLPDKCRSFRAIAGIDDRARPAGNVRLQILADDRTLFDESLSGKDAPRPLELDLGGANRLKFIVDFGLDQGTGDWLNLCEARILK